MLWSEASLSDLIASLRRRSRDFSDVEVKRASGGVPHLGQTLCALANMPEGGTIILGLDENDGFAAVGVRDPAGLEAGIADQARSLNPPVQVRFAEARIEGAALVVATVASLPLRDKPCRYAGSAYLRQSDGDYAMSEQEVRQFTEQSIMAQGGRPRHDAAPVDGTSVRDLDPQIVADFVATAQATSRRLSTQSDEAILRWRNVIGLDDERLTLAGLYALGSYPQRFAPSLSITAAVQLDPRSGDRTRDLVHLDGPLPELLDGAMQWVQRNTSSTIRYGDNGHAYDVSEIPLAAIRELIANALVHRDLSPLTLGKRVEIRLKDDTLVISNPGGLWGVSAQQLGTPRGKSAVNEYLYELCKLSHTASRARVIEGEGGGIREVRTALRHANLPPPQFIDFGVAFTVLVPRSSLIDPSDLEWLGQHDPSRVLDDRQRQIVASMRHGRRWTNALVREEFAPTDSLDARAALQGLVDLNLAEPVGERGGRAYVIRPQFRVFDSSSAPPRVVIERVNGQAEQVLPHAVAASATRGTTASGGDDPPLESEPPAQAAGLEVLEAIGAQPLTVRQIAQRTDLTIQQVRYRLAKLKNAGQIDITGGWGVKGTTYKSRTVSSE